MLLDEPIVSIKDLVELNDKVDVKEVIAKRYTEIIDACFTNFKNKSKIVDKYINNSREILDKYEENDYLLLKKTIINTRKNCYSVREIEKDVNTLQFQVNLLKSCSNHRDFLIKNLELMYSKYYKERREYNVDIYFAISDFLIEKAIEEQEEELWKTKQ